MNIQDPYFDPLAFLNFNEVQATMKQLNQPSTTSCSQLPGAESSQLQQTTSALQQSQQKLLEHKDRIIDLQDRLQRLTDLEHKQDSEIAQLKGQLVLAQERLQKAMVQSVSTIISTVPETKITTNAVHCQTEVVEVEVPKNQHNQKEKVQRCADSQTEINVLKCPVKNCELRIYKTEIGVRVMRSHIVDKSGCESHSEYRCKKCQWVMFNQEDLFAHRQLKDCIKELSKQENDFLNNWQKKKAARYIDEKREKMNCKKRATKQLLKTLNVFKNQKISIPKTKEILAAIYSYKTNQFQVYSNSCQSEQNEERTYDAEKNERESCLSEEQLMVQEGMSGDEEDYKLDQDAE